MNDTKQAIRGGWTAHGTITRADGTVRETFVDTNLVPDEGILDLLDRCFNTKSQASIYCGLKADSGIPASDWTYADINSLFTEFVGYDETLRPAWNTDPAAANKVVNPTTMNFTTTANGSVVTGAMLVTNATKDDSVASGAQLLSVLLFSSAKNLDLGEVLSLSFSFALSSA